MKALWLALLVLLVSAAATANDSVNTRLVAAGLYYPAGLALLPDGGVLIAEAGGPGERSAGISLLRPDGSLGRLISGLPSSYSSHDLISAPALAVTPDGNEILIALAGAQLFSLPTEYARELPRVAYGPQVLRRRQLKAGGLFLLHPFDIAFDADGTPVVTDAAGNGLVGESGGGLHYRHRFAALDNPLEDGGRLEALPTGLARHEDAFYAALLGGCPHVENGGELVAIGDHGQRRTIVDGLNMPIDVALDGDGSLWILEHGVVPAGVECFYELADEAATGRLSRIDPAGRLETVASGLHFPAALLPMPDGSIYVAEAYSGRLLQVRFGGPQDESAQDEALDNRAQDLDALLRAAIAAAELKPYPGRELIEPDSELTRLGRDLFFDPILSGDRNIACASCHHPAFAMTDGRVLPIGAGGHGLGERRAFRSTIRLRDEEDAGQVDTIINPFVDVFIPRNSPTIINSALLDKQFWDGRVEAGQAAAVFTLEDAINDLDMADPLMAQVLFPITSQHEMAGVTFSNFAPMVIRLTLLERLRGNADYARRFGEVFDGEEMSLRQLAEAVAAFERQLIFTASPWDDYLAGDASALNDQQKRGALHFFGELNPAVNCASCHSGDLFTDQDFHNLMTPQLGPGKNNGVDGRDDFGRANVTFDYRDQYRFKTPSLRNVELTAPYFHSGAYARLEDVIWHHADPWRANMLYDPALHLPAELQDQVLAYDFERQAHSLAQPVSRGLPLNADEVADLVAFLRALTDDAARDLSHITPAELPSGLPLDPLPSD